MLMFFELHAGGDGGDFVRAEVGVTRDVVADATVYPGGMVVFIQVNGAALALECLLGAAGKRNGAV